MIQNKKKALITREPGCTLEAELIRKLILSKNKKVKRIGVYPGKRLSLQSHKKRSEHWVIVKGHAKVQVGEDFHLLHMIV